MMQSIVVYVSLILVIAYFTKQSAIQYSNHKLKSNLYLMLAIIAFSVIFGLRYYVGVDYGNYLSVYEQADYRMFRYEPLFLLLTLVCQNYHLHFSIYFGIIAFIQILFLFLAFRNKRYLLPFLMSFLILSGDVMMGWMNILRHFISINIFVFATSILAERNLKDIVKYYVLVLLAVMFHSSALILVVIPLYLIKKSWFNNINIQCLLIIIFFFMQLVGVNASLLNIFEKIAALMDYDGYVADANTGGSRIGVFNIITLLLYLFIIINSKKIKAYFQKDKFFLIVYDFSIIGILLTYLFSGSMMLKRISLYFSVFIIPLCAYYVYYFSENLSNSTYKMKKNLIILYFVLLFLRVMMSMTTNTTQYVFYFQKEQCIRKELQFNSRNVEVN